MRVNLDRLFKYHRPRGTQPSRYAELRKAARAHADAIVAHTPESAEQTLAIRAVHQASMLANSAISVNEPDADEADPAWRAVAAADESPTLGDLQSTPAAALRDELIGSALHTATREPLLKDGPGPRLPDTRTPLQQRMEQLHGPSVPTRDTAGEWDHGRRLRRRAGAQVLPPEWPPLAHEHQPISADVFYQCKRCMFTHPVGAHCPPDGTPQAEVVVMAREELFSLLADRFNKGHAVAIEGLQHALNELKGDQSTARS